MFARNTATPDLPGIFMANPAQTSRPLSPHLQIWRFTPSMAASITHRITGTINYGGLVLVGVWLAALAFAPDLYGAVAGFVRSPLLGVADARSRRCTKDSSTAGSRWVAAARGRRLRWSRRH